jgi:glycerophosphoryl diester phosphodiesterase
VDDEEEMRSLLDVGVDGIVTDRPDVLRRVLGR